MNFRSLGQSGLRVSPLCLGTMMFGGPTDEACARDIVAAAAAAGVNFIDTADVYNAGRSEQIVGRAVAGRRDHWILATKVANAMGDGPHQRGLSRRWIMQAVEDSLARLGTDYIDIYYLHKEDYGTPLEETVRTMADLIRQGKIRYFGLSNFRGWRVAAVCALCDQLGIARPVVSQPYYNALNRMPEVEHLPACRHFGLGVVPYSPLARGVLTAKYDADHPPAKETRAGRADPRMMETEWRPESLAIARTLAAHAEHKGHSPIGFAIGWLLYNRIVTSVLAGPRTLAHWEGYVAALSYPFDADDETLLNSIVPAGHPSSSGYSDPAYPIEGREVG